MSGQRDLKALGFIAGLEIHQQLATPKLFCRCPSRLDEDDRVDITFTRNLKPTVSELGKIDPAALEEARKALTFQYVGHHETCCLVEMDEEPPHAMSPEALDVALETAFLLAAKPIDEIHIMRKIVVDGSNTSGFQRTSLVATDGLIQHDKGDVRVDSFCLEEDSARRLDRQGKMQRFRLDRLGIPLIEIATAPDLVDGEHARMIAEIIGGALRATEKVRRGIGTIRQDLNVSIREGARVEIKGVQELRLIEPAILWEVERQVNLLAAKEELVKRGAEPAAFATPIVDVGASFAASQANMIRGAPQGHSVYATRVPFMAGLLGAKSATPIAVAGLEMPPPRAGRELADHAIVKAGVKGIFQSDELPAYGITQAEVDAVREQMQAGEGDGFALVIADESTARHALEAVQARAQALLVGVPEETRDMKPDGTSRYMRPLPGGARMYPETDVPPVRLDEARLAPIRANLPEMPAERIARLTRDYADLGEEQARQLVRAGDATLFEDLVKASGLVKETARLLLSTLDELAADGFHRDAATPAHLADALRCLAAGKFAKEALGKVIRQACENDVTAQAAVDALNLGAMDLAELEAIIDAAIAANAELVKSQGARAQGPLMGPLMGQLHGKVSGKELSSALQRRLKAWLAENAA